MLLRNKWFCLRRTEGTAVDFAGGVAGREISEQLPAIVVEAPARANNQFRMKDGWLPGNAEARRNAPLAPCERCLAHSLGSVRVVAGNDKTGACDRVGCGVVAILLWISIEDVAIFLRQPAIPVVADAEGDAECGRRLELVLHKKPSFVCAITR